jgi:hypothetical protein
MGTPFQVMGRMAPAAQANGGDEVALPGGVPPSLASLATKSQ